MSSIVESIQKRNFLPTMPKSYSLPVSQPDPSKDTDNLQQGLRRRLSSLSLKLQPISSPASYSWTFPRSKSLSSMGEHAGSSIKKWWDMGLAWILSRKPSFARDLEMNEEEKHFIGSHNKGSWRHVFYKVKAEFRRLLRSDNVTLPQTFGYNSSDYSRNLDDGLRRQY
ncbi:hypothetical protein Ancab_017194 [Ancistrocladus abbreviatus]